MIWRPTGVEPVNDTTSTSGCVVSSAPTASSDDVEHVHDARRDVGRLGDELAERERRPRRVGRALQHHGAAGRERGRELRERELDRVVVRGDRADDAGGLLLDPAVVPARERVALAEVLDEVVALERDRRTSPRRRSGPRAADRSCSRPARRPRARGSRAAARRCRAAPGASWRRHRTRNAWSRDQSVVSNARRAARDRPLARRRRSRRRRRRAPPRSRARSSRRSRRRRPAPARRRSAAALRARSSRSRSPGVAGSASVGTITLDENRSLAKSMRDSRAKGARMDEPGRGLGDRRLPRRAPRVARRAPRRARAAVRRRPERSTSRSRRCNA